MSLIECKNLQKSFGKKQVLCNVNLSLEQGRIIGLLGKNGHGKSTLMKLINDLLTPTAGEILIEGKAPGVESKKIISYLPERSYFDPGMSGEAIIRYFGDFYEDFDAGRARGLLEQLDLDATQKLSKMSKGMREKLQLAMVLSRRAKLYLLDEPLGGVDPATRDFILDTVMTNLPKGATMLISTHMISDIERILDDVIFINHGEIVLSENCEQLRQRENATVDEIFRRRFKC